MKTTTFLALSAALFGLSNAAPVNRRELIVQTVTSEVVETVVLTSTVWVDPPSATGPSNNGGQFFETTPTPTPSSIAIPKSSSVAPASSSAPAPPPSSAPAPSSTPAPAPPAPSSTEAPPAPAPTSQAPAPAPPVVTSAPAPAPEPSAQAQAPAPEPVKSSAPAPQAPAPQAPSTSTGGSGQYSGDMTYYTPGQGSCGVTNTESDWIVAISKEMFDAHTPGANPNKNTLCNKGIKIFYGGQSFDATITDRCAGCAKLGDLDMPVAMFNKITNGKGDGRVTSGMSWNFA